jgi:deoxyhypusine synthase
MGAVREFMKRHYLHFNARETVAAAQAYEEHLAAGGKMMVTLAGAMSTAQLGIILARMIREGKVHAISCTGANLEEDVFTLLGKDEFEVIQDWRALSVQDEVALYERGMNRVTDTCIPEDIMRHIEARLIDRWSRACETGDRKFPSEFCSTFWAQASWNPISRAIRRTHGCLRPWRWGFRSTRPAGRTPPPATCSPPTF